MAEAVAVEAVAGAGAWPQQPAWAACCAAAGLPQQLVAASSVSLAPERLAVGMVVGAPQQPPAAGGVNASRTSPMKPPLLWFVMVFPFTGAAEAATQNS
ncbi:hypothetical protein ACTWPT_06720 [Nonomuraea sp. 3N208]|uniref:hypothetical protein n=1 Tax=Nonomuraea sp. 3N208 TaxID=3457421 RepID=UPI003FCE3C7A